MSEDSKTDFYIFKQTLSRDFIMRTQRIQLVSHRIKKLILFNHQNQLCSQRFFQDEDIVACLSPSLIKDSRNHMISEHIERHEQSGLEDTSYMVVEDREILSMRTRIRELEEQLEARKRGIYR